MLASAQVSGSPADKSDENLHRLADGVRYTCVPYIAEIAKPVSIATFPDPGGRR
jgi:hypothetical protein